MPESTENDKSKTPPAAFDFDKWLAEQSDEVKGGLEAHTAGLKKALDSERESAKSLKKAQKDAQEAAEEAKKKELTEQGQYKALAEQAQAKLAEFEKKLGETSPLAERAKALEAALEGYVKKEREGLPKHILALLDALPLEKQLEYLTVNREALRASAPGGGPPPTPKPTGEAGQLSDAERRAKAWRLPHL